MLHLSSLSHFVALVLALSMSYCSLQAPKSLLKTTPVPIMPGSVVLDPKDVVPFFAVTQFPVNYAPPLDGQLVGIFRGGTLQLMRDVMASKPGTLLLASRANPNNYIFAEYVEYGVKFVSLDGMKLRTMNGILGLRGQLANVKTFDELKNTLVNRGWDVIKPITLADFIKTAIAAGTIVGNGEAMFLMWTLPPDFENWLQLHFNEAST